MGRCWPLGLVKRGFRVEIYERRPDMRRVRMSAGRSINLALSTRGIHALTEAGLWNEMRKIIIPDEGKDDALGHIRAHVSAVWEG